MIKQSGEAYRNIRLCVDSYERGVPTGRYYHPGMEGEARAFQSLTQFLLGAESWMDSANFPQSYTAKRSFAPISEGKPNASETARPGKLATFTIRILFRQHASWQGSVSWLEGNGEQTFRSVLELILLLDSALGARGGAEAGNETEQDEAE